MENGRFLLPGGVFGRVERDPSRFTFHVLSLIIVRGGALENGRPPTPEEYPMFEQNFFQEEVNAGPGRAGRFMGQAGSWLLHVCKVLFLLYSGYHGISASLSYAGSSELAKGAQVFGIIVLELTLFGLYLAWHNQEIGGTAQSIAAGGTYGVLFLLAILGIVGDSQLHAGYAVSDWLRVYLTWGLPAAPALAALGALLTHELAPTQLRARRQSAEKLEFEDEQFKAFMAGQRAEMATTKLIRNLQLNARMSAAKQIAAWYGSDEAQQAITSTALQHAPALLRAIGVAFQEDEERGAKSEPPAAAVELPEKTAETPPPPTLHHWVMEEAARRGTTQLEVLGQLLKGVMGVEQPAQPEQTEKTADHSEQREDFLAPNGHSTKL